jgi:hypothetical protein
MRTQVLGPHGQHQIELLEDAEKPGNRIYKIHDRYDQSCTISMLGEELEFLLQWWSAEAARIGIDADD